MIFHASLSNTSFLNIRFIVPDIDECESGQKICTDNMLCVNDPGSYRCVGKTGYIATVENVIFACKDINQCLSGSHGCQGNCSNTESTYLCMCME